MAVNYLTVAMAMIPLGFVIFIWGLDKGNNTNTYAGAIIIAIAIVTWIGALRLATKEQKQERDDRMQQHNELLAELKGIREDLKKK